MRFQKQAGFYQQTELVSTAKLIPLTVRVHVMIVGRFFGLDLRFSAHNGYCPTVIPAKAGIHALQQQPATESTPIGLLFTYKDDMHPLPSF